MTVPQTGSEMGLSYSFVKRGLSLKSSLEELCTKLELDPNCWQDTTTGLFIFRSSDYSIQVIEYSCLLNKHCIALVRDQEDGEV